MPRALSLAAPVVLFLCLACSALAQDSASSSAPGSSAVQVVYTVDGSTLTTYNVDPQTLQPVDVGTVAMPQSEFGPNVIMSANGRFLYYMLPQNNPPELYVYDTNASGLPGSTPVQTIDATGFGSVAIDWKSKFLYAVFCSVCEGQNTKYDVIRYLIDPRNGTISQPVTEATYTLSSVPSSTNCSPLILGFNGSGSIMYDEISCRDPEDVYATYNERSVNSTTGALGSDVEIYQWSGSYGSGGTFETVQFIKNLMFDFVVPSGTEQQNLVNIYRLQPNENSATPRVSCGSTMMAACADFVIALAPRSGEYVFLIDPDYVTDIGRVDLTTRQISETSTIPYETQQFSPNGAIAYAVNTGIQTLEIDIYGFDQATGSVTAGGTITAAHDYDSWFTTQRD